MSKQVYTVTKEGIEYVCSLINQIVTLPSDVIDDLNIATNTTYSSYKLNVDLNNLETNINDRTDKLIASLNKLSKKIITAESEIVDENTLYLLLIDSTNNVYQQWLLIDGSPVMVGTTEMSLDSVYTKDETDVKFGLKTVSDTLVTEVAGIKETIGTEDLTTIATTLKGAINELEAKHYLEVYDLQNTSVLDYAKTFDALTHNYFYANNCIDLPDNMNYGYCAVDVSQDPLYRDITFYCPTTGRIYVNTIGADPNDATVFGTWSGWHRHLNDDDIVTTLDDTVTDNQIPSAKAVYNAINTLDNNVYHVKQILLFDSGFDGESDGSIIIGKEYTAKESILPHRMATVITFWRECAFTKANWYDKNWFYIDGHANDYNEEQNILFTYEIRILINQSDTKIFKVLYSKRLAFNLNDNTFTSIDIKSGIALSKFI